jgi:Putative beta-barrel porin-2, OmpL-like. bbp2
LKALLLLSLLLIATTLLAQTDTTKTITISGYGEMYYSYDFSTPQNHEKPNFIYNHKRHNEINANLICVKANYTDKTTRANLGIMAGNYPHYNLQSEPSWATFISEANIGIKISENSNLWLDAGILPSHIGFESAISADCWTLTRSILAENSPYFETGLKLGYTTNNNKLNVAFLVLNGWQKIKKPNYIQQPSIGVQINYKPTEKATLNYSNFVGTDKADSLNATRIFHNAYLQYEPNKKIGFIVGFDIGTDKYNHTDYGVWFSPVLIVKYTLNNQMKVAVRGEYYNDKNEIMITTNTVNGFQTTGISTNFDYTINDKVQCRIEGKIFQSKDNIFATNTNQNYCITTNLTFRF